MSDQRTYDAMRIASLAIQVDGSRGFRRGSKRH
jgi:hypothetical protein